MVGCDPAASDTGGYVTRIRHETLPAGLSAIVRRRADGDLDVIVSTTLSAGRQRAAVRVGLRAIQPARRRAAALPVPALVTLALAGTWLRAVARLLRVRPVATIAVAAAAAAVVAIAAVPYLQSPAVPGRNPAGTSLAPGSAARPTAPAHGRGAPSAPARAQPLPSAMPVAARSPTGATAPPATSQPSPGTSAPMPTPGAPTPVPTPTPAGDGGGICLEVLGLWICV
jgi:hypothetical protein